MSTQPPDLSKAIDKISQEIDEFVERIEKMAAIKNIARPAYIEQRSHSAQLLQF